jgi:hypothetical protein
VLVEVIAERNKLVNILYILQGIYAQVLLIFHSVAVLEKA